MLYIYLNLFEKLRNYKEGMDSLSIDNLDGFNHNIFIKAINFNDDDKMLKLT